jgi:glycosyltransferase involved in cell wall biosynthesis
MKGETLGACMIVKNEESCLGKCLESIKGIDEIVILDTGSVDKTGDIARAHGATFIEGVYQWEDDFSKARNRALAFATTDWILIIDADETLSEGGLDVIRTAIANAKETDLVLKMDVIAACDSVQHEIVRVHRRRPDIFWKGAAHNYLTIQQGPKIDCSITYGWSKAHDLDPDRTFRILKKFVEANPEKPRELYYLAREYFVRNDYLSAANHYERYLKVAKWGPEMADAWLMVAKCAVGLNDIDSAWIATCRALQINADLSEGLQTLAALSGPNNRKKWLEYAAISKNDKALFIRDIPGLEEVEEKGPEYYKAIFKKCPDMSRYYEIYRTVALMCKGKILDMGCGTGALKNFIGYHCEYKGFDFCGVAEGPGFEQGNIYEYPLEGYDTYVCLEVLEHVDDIAVLKRIPCGKTVIFSVPSFPDDSHLRTYTIPLAAERFGDYFSEMELRRFDMHDGKWTHGGAETKDYILLIKGVKK